MKILKQHFSHCFDKSGNFDFDKFKQELSQDEETNFSKESYGLEWLGKSYARLLAGDEAKTLLKEDKKWNTKTENKNSQNLLIKGDNLEVLKHLSNAYYQKIKMIYIDPPYNTASDNFVYQDDRKFSVAELSELAGVSEEKAQRILDFTQSKSNSHSAWLSFMYPRLYVAKQLLKDDGVIFISIDDNEQANLKLLCDEIFGEDNFVGQIIVKNNPGGRDYGGIAVTHEYIIAYSKNDTTELNLVLDDEKKFSFKDDIGEFDTRELRNRNTKFNDKNRPNLCYPFYVNDKNIDKNGFYEISLEEKKDFIKVMPLKSQEIQTVWRWGKDKVLENININVKAKLKNDGTFMIVEKYRSPYKRERSIWDEKNIRNEAGSLILKNLFDKKIFDYPKSVNTLKRLILLGACENDLILDFFAGSGTTGDAVMQLNAEDGGKRQFILVQWDEPAIKTKTEDEYNKLKNKEKEKYHFDKEYNLYVEPTETYKFCKENSLKPVISSITQERLLRSAKKLQNENPNMDTGFKIFETIPNDEGVWKNFDFKAKELRQDLEVFDERGLREEDLHTLLTTWKTYDNIPLPQDLDTIDLAGYKGHYCDNKLYLIYEGFTTENLKSLLNQIDDNKDFNPANIYLFGFNFESKVLRELAENIKNYSNKKNIDIDLITRY